MEKDDKLKLGILQMQKFRSQRLRESYRTDNYEFNDINKFHKVKDDDIPRIRPCIVIDSGDEGPMRVESESESYRPQIYNIEEEEDNQDSACEEVSDQEENFNQEELFAEMKAQFKIKLIQNHESPPPAPQPIEEEIPEPVSYEEYKILITKQLEQEKIEKAKQKLKEQDLLEEEQPKKERIQKLVPKEVIAGKKDNESMGDFMSRMVVTFDKDNRRKGRKSRVVNVGGGSLSRQRSESRQRKSEPRSALATAIQTVASSALASSIVFDPITGAVVESAPRQKTQEEQFVEDMLKIYNEDRPENERPEQCDLLNYDVLFKTKRIIQRALMPPPRFKDDFYFTHLYQEQIIDSPTGRRRGKKKGGKYTQDTNIHYSYKADLVIPQSGCEDRQIKKLQTYAIQEIIGKRVNLQGYMEYMCMFDKARKSWILQSLMMKDYEALMLRYEILMRQKQMESQVCNSVMKIKEAFTFCLLSHVISDHKELPKIVYLKQAIIEKKKIKYDKEEDLEKNQRDLEEEQQQQIAVQMFKSQTTKRNKKFDEIDINDSPVKKPKDRKKVTDEEDNNQFDKQIQLMQMKDIEKEQKALRKQQDFERQRQVVTQKDDVSSFGSPIHGAEEVFIDMRDEKDFKIIEEVEDEDQTNIQDEIKKMQTQKSSFKVQLQQERIKKLMLQIKQKQSMQEKTIELELGKVTLFR